MRHLLILIATFGLITFGSAQNPITLAHTQNVQVGPYVVTVGFSRWPVQADRSFDLTFDVEGGIEGKEGTVTLVAPTLRDAEEVFNYPFPLSRFARDRNVWGFDVIAFPEEGQWKYQFVIDGPQGRGEGAVDIVFLERPPFLPSIVNWSIGFIPLIALIVLIVVGWLSVRPGNRKDTWTWNEAV